MKLVANNFPQDAADFLSAYGKSLEPQENRSQVVTRILLAWIEQQKRNMELAKQPAGVPFVP